MFCRARGPGQALARMAGAVMGVGAVAGVAGSSSVGAAALVVEVATTAGMAASFTRGPAPMWAWFEH